jgi:ribosomal protein S27AE
MTDELRGRLDAMATLELIEILRERDFEAWRPEVFPLVEEILAGRRVDVAAVQATPSPRPDVLDHEALETVASLSDPLQANLCRMALLEAGIQAWLPTENLAAIAPPLGVAFGIAVLVRPEDAAAAREVIAGIEAGAAAIPEESDPCPRCGSVATEHVSAPDREGAVMGWLMVGLPRPAVIWRWRCGSCGHTWE